MPSSLPIALFRVDEAAKILNLRPKTLRNKISAREIDVIRIGRNVRISQETLQELIERGFMPAKESAA
jgi:excisionase family DNA binding protein